MTTETLWKWSIIDGAKVAHWWVGAVGTACGRDFKQDIHAAYGDDPQCGDCIAALSKEN